MERIIAYQLYKCSSCRLKFLEALSAEGFELIEHRDYEEYVTNVIRTKKTDKMRQSSPLGQINESHLILYPTTNRTDVYDISEHTRLVRLCDEFKIG